jgi:hypothetical protein
MIRSKMNQINKIVTTTVNKTNQNLNDGLAYDIFSTLQATLLYFILPLLLASIFNRTLFYLIMCKPVHLWIILAYCQVIMVFLVLATSSITSLFYSPRNWGKVRLRWCRTPHGYHIHRYGSALRMECIRHLHTKFKKNALVQAPLRTFNTITTSHVPVTPAIGLLAYPYCW